MFSTGCETTIFIIVILLDLKPGGIIIFMFEERFTLPAVPPFRLDLTVWALRRRENNWIDRWDGRHYARVFSVGRSAVQITVAQENPGTQTQVEVLLHCRQSITLTVKDEIQQHIQKILGLDVSLEPFYALAAGDEAIGSLVRRFMGVKPPRFPDLFETLVNSIACQQVTLNLGILLLDRLAEKFGAVFLDEGTPRYAFPRPADLADVPEDEIKVLGFSRQKVRAIQELASALETKQIDLAKLDEMTDQEAVDFLTSLRGIGRWSAEYVLLRGLRRLDTFPGDDIGAQNNLQRLFQLDHRPTYAEIKQLTARWHPYEGLVYFHLLLDKLSQKGFV